MALYLSLQDADAAPTRAQQAAAAAALADTEALLGRWQRLGAGAR
jgi:hypothetical protein